MCRLFSFIAGGIAKCYSYFGRKYNSSYKAKYSLIVWSSNCTPSIPTDLKTCLYKYLHINIYSILTHNHPNWKWPKCFSVGEWRHKCWYRGNFFKLDNLQINCQTTKQHRELKCISASEKNPVWKDDVLYYSNYIRYCKMQKYIDGELTVNFHGFERGKRVRCRRLGHWNYSV